MKGTNLGEFEELVMLVVAVLFDNAYGVAIQNEIKAQCGRTVTISTVHSALHRLEKKGYLESRQGDATPERGGRRKLLFNITAYGEKAIISARDQRGQLWNAIPKIAFKHYAI